MMPSLFLSHGTPLLALEKNSYTLFLKEYMQTMKKPAAIVILSAHWENEDQMISAVGKHEVIYDFAGFPEEIFQITYPARGCLELSDRILTLLSRIDVLGELDERRPLDHGAWGLLHIMYPEADIPTVSMSISPSLPLDKQYEIGKALRELKENNVLIIGSGGIVHNFTHIQKDMHVAEGWAIEFENWIEEKIMKWDLQSLFNYENIAPYSTEAVPSKEHIIPLVIAMGTGDDNKKAALLHRSFQYGNLSLTAWKFE
ncbi:dioxygenase [Peribacillus frigoritolerans]|uniref:dioxygenase family protein n=2 Tax=Peribacillus frigoritolerans TaxID=450367 RepID=UPI0019294A3E|nr:class III extradiol ring-cleavage dioxygenase [Peribacillus frigoritolerans]MBL3645025.1 dioxygenase [Bacillus sp. RHFB]MEE3952836.1 class III extradiol ring-cleavage dioxygenase [Peribacillus frigoritolerans]